MKSRSPVINFLIGVLVAGLLVWPFLSLFKVTGGPLKSFTLGNRVTPGKVIYVGPSRVSSSPAVVGYGYNTPEYPRKPWSFQREQVVTKQDAARYRVGMSIPVEYSQASPGSSRIKGYGKTSSVFLDEFGGHFLVLFCLLAVTAIVSVRRTRG
jgi:hypothetical protein